MKIKKGASLNGLQISMRPALIVCDSVLRGLGKELVITSGTDGEHSAGSLHYYGLAFDIRIRHLDDIEKKTLYRRLQMQLSSLGFQVIIHHTHIHIEFDEVKNGRSSSFIE